MVWILFSDALINAMSDDIDVHSRLQSAKGSLFVVLSAVAIYVLIRFHGHPERAPEVPSAETGDERPGLRLQLLLLAGVTTLPLIAPITCIAKPVATSTAPGRRRRTSRA